MTVLLYKKCDKWFYLPLVLSFGFLFSYSGIHQCYGKIQKLQSSLSPQELALYQEVAEERKNIYWSATMQSLLLVVAYLLFQMMFCGIGNPYYLISNLLCIFLGGIFLFYTLLPKKKSMILDANLSSEETKRWYQVYLCMQNSFWKGFVMGLLVSGFVLMLLDTMSNRAEMMVIPLKKKGKASKKK